ncbi:hypothetical protein K7887_03065 [Sutcliffiella horikoshii]|uniref:hypothetical protein n=1 Tax=Sutcliffiella horikoshii TaxID=79883 RepID=UPI001CBAD51F|nr:hypothetical protein [Sutcliffiella horikoshii]UAL47964.1 hypothetical protein K7887_03065 [Sutcliffiella horikoshii]
MKKYLVQIGIVLLILLIAFFINPKELYYSFKAEKEIEIIRGIVEEGIGEEKYKIKEITHISENSFLVETNSNSLLIQSKKQVSGTSYEIFVYGLTIERYMNK